MIFFPKTFPDCFGLAQTFLVVLSARNVPSEIGVGRQFPAASRQQLNLSGKLQLRKVRRNPLTALPLCVAAAASAAPLFHQRQGARETKWNQYLQHHHSWRWRRSPVAPTSTDAGQRCKLGVSKRKAEPQRQTSSEYYAAIIRRTLESRRGVAKKALDHLEARI
jgi:hypothetical protein